MTEHKILVVRLSSLGDIVLTAPVYRNIKAHWPDARITLLTKPQFAAAMEGHPCIDEVIVFKGIWQTLKEIKKRGFTHYLDLHANLRTFVIGLLSGIRHKARYSKDSMARRLFVGMRIPNPALQRHVLDKYLDSLSSWGIPVEFRTPELADWTTKNRAGTGKGPARICIFQTAFLGDTVLTVPLIKETAKAFPDARISVVSLPATAEIFRSVPEVSEIIPDTKKSTSLYKSTTALAKRLRDARFDVIITPHRSFRSALVSYLSGAPVRIGFHTSAGKFFYTRLVPFSWLLHDAERNLALLNPLITGTVAPSPVSIPDNETLKADIRRRLKEAGYDFSAPLVGVHPGSAWFTKKWPAERFAGLIKKIKEAHGAQVVIVGGKEDRKLADSIISESGVPALNWTGETTIPELLALMPNLSLFVTNDSGPMHIAVAFSVPTLAIFGPTTKELGFFPYGQGHKVLQAELACRPCALHGGRECPHGHFLCMRLITVDSAFRAASELLEKRK